MKISFLALATSLLESSIATSSPTAGRGRGHQTVGMRCPFSEVQKQGEHLPEKRSPLGFKSVDVTGEHAFQPPRAGDQRGPCPGLNALANHGYIPRNGVVNYLDAIAAINKVYGMGVDLALILATMGLVWTGNPVSLNPSFSIGGYDPSVQNLLGNALGLLGTPRGLKGSHNFIEADSSNTRSDIYLGNGDNYSLQMDQFMEWYNMTEYEFSSGIMAKRAAIRFRESISENPNFYYGPITGFIARNAGYLFPLRLLANHTDERPEGILTKDVVRNFFAVYGEEGNFEYKPGWERIPENWYGARNEYGLVQLNADLVDWVLQYPELASIGGNTGKVNTFTGVDLGNLTGGVYNTKTLLEGNNLICFVLELVKFGAPNSLSPLFATLELPLQLIQKALAAPLLSLACPAMKDLTEGGKPLWSVLSEQFPGAGNGAL